MNQSACFEWCKKYRHSYPDDFITAGHVKKWLCEKAKEICNSENDFLIVEDANQWATNKLKVNNEPSTKDSRRANEGSIRPT